MKKTVALALSAALALALAGCGEKTAPGGAARKEVRGVEIQRIEPSSVPEYMEASGTVKARTISAISSRVMGAVTSIKAREGDRVRAGQLLLTIDDSGIRDKAGQAQAALEGAKKALESAKANLDMTNLTCERYKKLYDSKAISGQEFDQMETQRKAALSGYGQALEGVRQAEAGLGEARAFLAYTRISAPFAGVVTARMTDAGSMASPGMPLLTVEDTSEFLLDVYASEKYVEKLRRGMAVRVAIDAIPGAFEGRIVEAVPSVDPQSRTFLVKIALKGKGLRTGLYAKVMAQIGQRTALLVPEASLVEQGGLKGVYAVDNDGVITYRLVRAGGAFGHDIEILSGLSAGDRVIVKGTELAADGGVVK